VKGRADPRRLSPALTPEVISDGARIAALRNLGLLATEAEPEFDRFTRLAVDLLGVPVALVSLVERDRQFFKSACGLSGDWAHGGQTPLSHTFCQHVVARREPLVIADTRQHPLVSDNLAARDLSVIAYAGIPLTLADGHVLGAFCAIHTHPHEWTEHELRILGDLAAAVRTQLELRRALAHQSLRDSLTGLPNRALTVAYADQLTAAHGGSAVLALAVGLDDMGMVNDAYGTAHGDRILSLVSRRIAHQLGSDDILGRVEGDVFAILRPRAGDGVEALKLAHRVRAAIGSEPVAVRGDRLSVSATVGVATAAATAVADANGGGATLLTRAAEAMRLAKHRRDQVVVSESETAVHSAAQLRLRGALTGAITRNEIGVAFQPIVELHTGRTCGFEALARWLHPELGPIPPAEFVPVAEASGEIVRIGEHVLRVACHVLRRWRAQSGDDLQVTVNFSPVQLAVPNIADVVTSILAECELPGTALALEITEGVFLSPGEVERRNLERIRETGVQIALDDFGTGYSTLSFLKRLPVDVLKVDRCFLAGVESDRRDAALMRAILSIGSGMDLQVVAEGIETETQCELLRLSGCRLGQGFLFAHPLPADEIHVTSAPPAPTTATSSAAA
jgi:diguanylate cyclase (GGDEF)-like protein